MWNTTIGVEQDAGANSAIEASLRAPTRGGGAGGGREARRQAAQDLIEAGTAQHVSSVCPYRMVLPKSPSHLVSRFCHPLSRTTYSVAVINTLIPHLSMPAAGYQPTVSTFEDLVALARSKNIGGEGRGACKVCGGLGHLTKQCRNKPAPQAKHSAAGMIPIMQLIPPDSDREDSMSSLGSLSSSSDSDSDSSEERRKKRKRKSSSSGGKEKSSSKDKEKKGHKSNSSSSKHKKHKKSSKEKRHKSSSKDKRHKSSRHE
jgi:hypothetical protein